MAVFDRTLEMSSKELHAHVALVKLNCRPGALGKSSDTCQRQAAVMWRYLRNLEVLQRGSRP